MLDILLELELVVELEVVELDVLELVELLEDELDVVLDELLEDELELEVDTLLGVELELLDELDELDVELELLDVLEVVELLEAVETELLDVDEDCCSFLSAQPVKIAEIAKIPAASLILFIIFLPNCIFSPL